MLKLEQLKSIAQYLTARKRADEALMVWSRSQELVTQLGFPERLVSFFTQIDGVDVLQETYAHRCTTSPKKRSLHRCRRDGRNTLAIQVPEKPFLTDFDWSTENYVSR